MWGSCANGQTSATDPQQSFKPAEVRSAVTAGRYSAPGWWSHRFPACRAQPGIRMGPGSAAKTRTGLVRPARLFSCSPSLVPGGGRRRKGARPWLGKLSLFSLLRLWPKLCLLELKGKDRKGQYEE